MNHVQPGKRYRVKLRESTLVGTFDYPQQVRENKFLFNPNEDFWEGTIELILDTGQILDLHWDEKIGVYCDELEEL